MTIIIGLLIPFIGTIIGVAFVFFMKDEMSPRLQKTLLGFASGVMCRFKGQVPYTNSVSSR